MFLLQIHVFTDGVWASGACVVDDLSLSDHWYMSHEILQISSGTLPCIVDDLHELYLQATPLLLTLAVVELSDVAFAVSVSLLLWLVILESRTLKNKRQELKELPHFVSEQVYQDDCVLSGFVGNNIAISFLLGQLTSFNGLSDSFLKH